MAFELRLLVIVVVLGLLVIHVACLMQSSRQVGSGSLCTHYHYVGRRVNLLPERQWQERQQKQRDVKMKGVRSEQVSRGNLLQSRRQVVTESSFCGGLLAWMTKGPNALAVDAASASSSPSSRMLNEVYVFPGIEYLEPMYELKLSIEAIALLDATSANKYPRLMRRLQDFFRPTSFQPDSEAGTYRKLGQDYGNQIMVASSKGGGIMSSSSSVDVTLRRDKALLIKFMEDTIRGLEELLHTVEEQQQQNDSQIVQACAQKPLHAINQWFALVPSRDVIAVDALIRYVRSADQDRDGKLNPLELANLPLEQRQVWDKRVALFGNSKVERCLGFKLTETSSY